MAKLSDNQKDVVLNKLAELASELQPSGVSKKASLSIEDKERMVQSVLADPTGRGMRRIA